MPALRTISCPDCAAEFTCGDGSGTAPDRCWCQDQPVLHDLSAAKDCLCPACLARAIARETGAAAQQA